MWGEKGFDGGGAVRTKAIGEQRGGEHGLAVGKAEREKEKQHSNGAGLSLMHKKKKFE